MRLWPGALAAVAACSFSPQYHEDLACGPGGECPPDYHCDEPTRTCQPGANDIADAAGPSPDSAGGPDAPPPDASAPDARPDAAPVGCASDDDCKFPPNLCLLPGTCDLDAGICDFPAVDCSFLDGECGHGRCDFSDGTCVLAPQREGQSCGAGSTCSYGDCAGFSGECDESGSQEGTCVEHTCSHGACAEMASPSTIDCGRDTEGDPCGDTTCGAPFGTCVFEGHPVCDASGSRTTTCTGQACTGGACVDSAPFTGSEPCSRSTAGLTCSSTTCGGYGLCGGFADACAVDGTQSRTCTDFTCSGDSCSGSPRMEMRACTRPSRNGLECMPPECDLGCVQNSPGTCSMTGHIDCTSWTCAGTVCSPASSTQTCIVDTNGQSCGSVPCPVGGMLVPGCCSAGLCAPCFACGPVGADGGVGSGSG